MPRHPALAADDAGERVVERDAGAVVEPVPRLHSGRPGLQRYQDRQRAYQMRSQAGGEQSPFPQRLVYQTELELLQVPQPAVDELAGPAGRTGG